MKYICELCGWVYDEEETGVKFEDLPPPTSPASSAARGRTASALQSDRIIAIKRYRSEISLRYVIA